MRRHYKILCFAHCRMRADYAELNAPPMINYGVVYPQSILIFVITMLYSVVQPLILVFGALYFGIAYIVYKYKLLFGMWFKISDFADTHIMQSFTSRTNPKAKLGLLLSFDWFGAWWYSWLSWRVFSSWRNPSSLPAWSSLSCWEQPYGRGMCTMLWCR